MRTAIRDISDTLIALLRDSLGGLVPPSGIVMLSPSEVSKLGANPPALALFLYAITPTAELRNAPEVERRPGQFEPPALPLDLYYLLTAYTSAQQAPTTDPASQTHLLLGAAIQVFNDNAMLTGSVLKGDLPRDEELRLTFQPITVEDLTRLWGVFPGAALQPTVSYLVSPAKIRSQRTKASQRVVSQQTDTAHIVPNREETIR
ncbi:MAG: DUF4255 domain-containing protein [Candidatus Binatia bacterium]